MSNWVKRGNAQTIAEVITRAAGVSEQELLNIELEDPRNIDCLTSAADAFMDAVLAEQPIYIIGDYDSDGLNATAILSKLLSFMGSSFTDTVNATTIIPKRLSEGYGLSTEIIKRIPANSFVLTIDNGISAVDEVKTLKEKNCTVAILDHHLPGDVLPPADFLADPHINPDNNGFAYYCGAGLGYQFARYLLEDDASPEADHLRKEMAVHAAIATVTDMMPLLDANRVIVKDGLKIINEHRTELSGGLQALLDTAATDIFDEDTFGFKLGPIINAPARLYNAGGTSVLKELICTDLPTAKGYADKMVTINETRKSLVQEWTVYIMDQLEDSPIQCPLCVYIPGVPEGIIGIIAGKLSETYRMPAFMFSDSGENGVLKGSGRSGGYMDLTPILDAIRPLTVKCGGHSGAAGISVTKDNFKKMSDAMRNRVGEGAEFSTDRPIEYDLELSQDSINKAYYEMNRFAPFGQGVQKPVFLIRNFRCVTRFGSHFRCMGPQKEHLKLNGTDSDAVGFGMAEQYLNMGSPAAVDILCTLAENRYNGKTSIQLSMIDFRPTQGN